MSQIALSRQAASGAAARGLVVALPPDTLGRLLAAAKRKWKCYRKELKRCQKHFSEKAVHATRVESRRLLSISELLAPFCEDRTIEGIRNCLKRHLDTFDALRDTQVQRTILKDLCQKFAAAKTFRAHLRTREKRLTRKASKRIKQTRVRRLSKLLRKARDGARAWWKRGARETINGEILAVVDGAFRRTVELRSRIQPARSETIHCTRIAFKRFRYMVETLAEIVPVPKKYLPALHEYQTLMGDIQDMEVMTQAYDAFASESKLRDPGVRALKRELRRRHHELVRRYLAEAGRLDGFWRLERPAHVNGDFGAPRRAGAAKKAGAGETPGRARRSRGA